MYNNQFNPEKFLFSVFDSFFFVPVCAQPSKASHNLTLYYETNE